MTAPPAGALEACLALLEKATGGEWDTCYRGTYTFGPESDVIDANGEDVEGAEFVTPPGNQPTTRGSLREADARAIVAAVNLLKDHGPALLAALRLRESCEGLEKQWRSDAAGDADETWACALESCADDLARVLEEGE